MAMAFFSRSTFCIVTGASKGLGYEIAMQLAQGWCKAGECETYACVPAIVSRA